MAVLLTAGRQSMDGPTVRVRALTAVGLSGILPLHQSRTKRTEAKLKKAIGIAALLLLGSLAVAGDIKVDGSTKVPAHSLVQLKAVSLPAGSTVFWTVNPRDGSKTRLTKDQVRKQKDCLVFTGPSDAYVVNVRVVWTVDKDTGALDGYEQDIDVTIGDEKPVPDPPAPKPGPTPDPTPPKPNPVPPKADKLWLIVVKDNEAMTPAIASVVMDKSLWDEVEKAGHRWRVYSSASNQASAKGFTAFLKEKSVALPGLVVMDAQGNRLAAMQLPSTKDGVLGVLKEYGK